MPEEIEVADEGEERISLQVKKQIRKEAISQVAKWSILAFVLLFGIAASGWWFYLQEKLNAYIVQVVYPPEQL
jgi:hypothetical protein